MRQRTAATYTATLDDGRVIYAGKPNGNLVGELPCGARPLAHGACGTLDRKDGGDPYEAAVFGLPSGRTVTITRDAAVAGARRHYYMATIELLVEAASEAEACDAISEGMRPNFREFAGPSSSWIDWRYADDGSERGAQWPKPHDGEGFEYAEPCCAACGAPINGDESSVEEDGRERHAECPAGVL